MNLYIHDGVCTCRRVNTHVFIHVYMYAYAHLVL